MKTSWRTHRPHAIASLAFRAAAAIGFGLGLLYALQHAAPASPGCDIERAACLARLVRDEAIFHVGPPLAGLVAGIVLGSWLARGVHRYHRRARTA
jgi:hypothetical protein